MPLDQNFRNIVVIGASAGGVEALSICFGVCLQIYQPRFWLFFISQLTRRVS